jgi:hypothetical protein
MIVTHAFESADVSEHARYERNADHQLERDCASTGFREADSRQRAVIHPLVENGFGTTGAVTVVEVINEAGQYAAAFVRIGDDGGHGRQIGHHAVLEVEDEM